MFVAHFSVPGFEPTIHEADRNSCSKVADTRVDGQGEDFVTLFDFANSPDVDLYNRTFR